MVGNACVDIIFYIHFRKFFWIIKLLAKGKSQCTLNVPYRRLKNTHFSTEISYFNRKWLHTGVLSTYLRIKRHMNIQFTFTSDDFSEKKFGRREGIASRQKEHNAELADSSQIFEFAIPGH